MVRIAGDTLPHEIRGRNGILLRNTAAEVDGKWCTVGVGGLIPVGGPADSLIGWVALVAGRQRPYPIRDGNRHHTGGTGFAAALSAEVARSPGHDLFDLLPTPRSSIGYRYDWTTRLDKIKNLDDGADTRLSRALEQEQSGAFLADPDPPTATPAPQIVWVLLEVQGLWARGGQPRVPRATPRTSRSSIASARSSRRHR